MKKVLKDLNERKKFEENEMILIDKILNFLNDEIFGIQRLIRYNRIFRGIIIKYWFRNEVNETKHSNYNKKIVKKSI